MMNINMLSYDNTSPNIEFLYFKNDTCQPCKVLRVKVEELLKQHFPSIELKVIEIKEHQEFVESLRIFSSPTMVLLIDSREYYRGGIYTSIEDLKEKLHRLTELIK